MATLSKIIHVFLTWAIVLGAFQAATGAPTVEIERHKPCNLFKTGDPVALTAVFKGFPAGSCEATVTVANFFQEVITKTYPVKVEKPDGDTPVSLTLGTLEPGYYEMNVVVPVKGADGAESVVQSAPVSLGVVSFVNRTAKEAREGGYRFGMKVFQIRANNNSWKWDLSEVVDACAATGLQWTRMTFDQAPVDDPGYLSTNEMVTRHPMNVLLKVEGMPDECYDEARYGPKENWAKNHTGKRVGWQRCTVPKKEPYQAWLRQEIAKIPPEQNVFEIGNEVWNYMSAEEFAEWCRMIVPVVKELRPGAVIGAQPGEGAYADAFLAAGGLDGMNAVFLHPYTFVPMPETRTQMELRNERDYLRARTGRNFDFYVSEYGWSTAPKPKNGRSVTETVQAERTVRQSLMLYSEDMKTLVPHWMGDREQDPTDWDQWFGFFRHDLGPRPDLVAHVVSARMIDGSRYVGELWFGPGIGAMLFEKGGVNTLALWSGEDQNRNLQVDVGVEKVTMVDIMGREKTARTEAGKLALTLTPAVTYLVGVSPSMAQRAAGPDQDLNPDRWWTRQGSYSLPHLKAAPALDGDLKEWSSLAPIGPKDSPTRTWLAWDKEFLYVAAALPEGTANLSVQVGTRPSRQTDLPQSDIYDYQIEIEPDSAEGKGTLRLSNRLLDKPVEATADNPVSGLRIVTKKNAGGSTVEAAIPLKLLTGFPTVAGKKISAAITVQGAGKGSETSLVGNKIPAQWPYFILE